MIDGPEPQHRVAELEAKIEALAEAAERCRKLGIMAHALAWAGGLLLAFTLTGLVRDALGLVVGIAALLGGLTFQGSNRSTRDQIAAEIKIHEAQRADLIDGLDLEVTSREVGAFGSSFRI